MEKVTIKECKAFPNGKAHGVVFGDGRKATAWNDKVDSGILMQHFASHAELEVELTPWKTGSGLNITAINSSNTTMTSEAPVLQPAGQKGEIPMSHTDRSIVSQVMVKGAVELAKELKLANNEDLGKFLCMAVQELVGAYKVAYDAL